MAVKDQFQSPGGPPDLANRRRRGVLPWILLLAWMTLACSMGALSSSAPLFTPPADQPASTVIPDLIFPTQETVEVPSVGGGGEPIVIIDPTTVPVDLNTAPILYYAQPGDTLAVVAIRFGVEIEEIISTDPIPETGLLRNHQVLVIPSHLANTTSSQKILPDSEVVYTRSAVGFDVTAFVNQAGGYLCSYEEWLGSTEWTSGAEIIQRVALENSINPLLLLGLLEYQSGWVYGEPQGSAIDFPMGNLTPSRKGLYPQLVWAINQLSIGYYGWRTGLLTEIQFADDVIARLSPELNAGTVALQYYFSQIYSTEQWVQALDVEKGFPALFENMFGSPWLRSMEVEPLYPSDLVQPRMILPFFIGQLWNYTGGPHGAWEHDGSQAALDFSPSRDVAGCVESDAWVLAAAPGLVVRSGRGVVVLDLDGDGLEQTGWALLYLHIATNGRVDAGKWLETGDLVGRPSCEGGFSTGTHVHLARKYNGEWIAADGPLPFVMGGWVPHAGEKPYLGTLTRDGETVIADVYGSYISKIIRTRDDP